MTMYASFRAEFIQKRMHCMEICGYGLDNNEENEVMFFGAYDPNLITKWLEYLSKAKKFAEWFSKL